MTEHLSTEIVERFHEQALVASERALIRDHLLKCESCRKRIIDAQIESVGLSSVSDHLLVDTDDEPYHLEYGTIEGYVDGTLGRVDRDTAEMHLEVCAECANEVADLRESLATIKTATVRQVEKHERLRDGLWPQLRLTALPRPLWISAIVALAVMTVVAAIVVWRLKSGKNQAPNGEKEFIAGPSSSPSESPKSSQAVSSPLPSPGGSPRKTFEVNPSNPPLAQAAIALNDGPNRIVLERSGKLVGLETLPRETQQAVREALIAQTITRPNILDELNSAQVSVRAPSGDNDTPTSVYPANRVITEDRPLFEWLPAKTSSGYRVEIGDNQFRSAAKSDVLPSTTRSWIPPTPLKRGVIYTWVVRVIKEGGEGASMTPPKAFKILEEERIKELTRLKNTSKSHLALGVFYVREGMLAEAAREFQTLAKQNPHSQLAQRLAAQVESWQRQ